MKNFSNLTPFFARDLSQHELCILPFKHNFFFKESKDETIILINSVSEQLEKVDEGEDVVSFKSIFISQKQFFSLSLFHKKNKKTNFLNPLH